MTWLKPVQLIGKEVRLMPLQAEHEAGLIAAAQDGELWKLWYTYVPSPEVMGDVIAQRLRERDQGLLLPFTVFDANETIVGVTTYLNLDAESRRVEIGNTWYAKRVQRSAVNTECKFLLLQQAFENLDCIAVEFRTHRLNRQSRAAIERLGAQLDGILRAHKRSPNGTIRDTAVYSITATEWPVVRAHLKHQLQR